MISNVTKDIFLTPDAATLISSQMKPFSGQQSMHSGIGGNIRDDVSQRSALKSVPGKKKIEGKLGVNWGPNLDRAQSSSKLSVVSKLPIQTGGA